MTASTPRDDSGRDAAPDLEYDLAHEVAGSSDTPCSGAPPASVPVRVATQTDDDGGDYGYDLAHDVPR